MEGREALHFLKCESRKMKKKGGHRLGKTGRGEGTFIFFPFFKIEK